MEERIKFLEQLETRRTFAVRTARPKDINCDVNATETFFPPPTPDALQRDADQTLVAPLDAHNRTGKHGGTVESEERSLAHDASRFQSRAYFDFAHFVSDDDSFCFQRRLLMQQEQLQKHRPKQKQPHEMTGTGKRRSWARIRLGDLGGEGDANRSVDRDTEDASMRRGRDGARWNVSSWPQFADNGLYLTSQQQQLESAVDHDEQKGTSGLWSVLFSAARRPSSLGGKKRRIFPDPAYVLHLVLLRIRDNQETAAVALLQERLPSPSLLKKTSLRGLVNRILLHALDKGFETLALVVLEAGFPDSVHAAIFGATRHPRRFPSYLLVAINLGLEMVVRWMLEHADHPSLLNRSWFNGLNPLHIAQFCKRGQGSFRMTQLLLRGGASPSRALPYNTYLRSQSFLLRRERWPTKRSAGAGASSIVSSATASYCPTPTSLSTVTSAPAFAFASASAKQSRSQREILRNTEIFALDFACAVHKNESAHLLLGAKDATTEWLSHSEFSLLLVDDLEVAVDILRRAPSLIRQRDPRGNTPLHHAARSGRTDLIAVYLHFGLSVDVLNFYHWTPLHEAANRAHRASVQYLISRGADCSIVNRAGHTALQLARKQAISSEELYDFFHSADTIQRTRALIGELVDSRLAPPTSAEDKTDDAAVKTKRRFLIEKLTRYPKRLLMRSWRK